MSNFAQNNKRHVNWKLSRFLDTPVYGSKFIMKRNCSHLLLLSSFLVVLAANADQWIVTNSTENLVFQFQPLPDNGIAERICCFIESGSGQKAPSNGIVIFMPESAYFCRIELSNSNGGTVPRTAFGKIMGSHYLEFDGQTNRQEAKVKEQKHWDWNDLEYKATKPSAVQLDGKKIEGGWCRVGRFSGVNTVMSYSLLDIFEVTNTGRFNVSIEAQILRRNPNGTMRLVRFPLIEGSISVSPDDLIKAKQL